MAQYGSAYPYRKASLAKSGGNKQALHQKGLQTRRHADLSLFALQIMLHESALESCFHS